MGQRTGSGSELKATEHDWFQVMSQRMWRGSKLRVIVLATLGQRTRSGLQWARVWNHIRIEIKYDYKEIPCVDICTQLFIHLHVAV